MARVLLIEDCAQTRQILTLILAVHNHEVIVATGGHEGLRALEAAKGGEAAFDLIVTDLVMPQHDGFEMIRAAAGLQRRPKILLIDHPFAPSAAGQRPDYLRMALDLGADQVLANPVQVDALAEAIAALLRVNRPMMPLRRAS